MVRHAVWPAVRPSHSQPPSMCNQICQHFVALLSPAWHNARMECWVPVIELRAPVPVPSHCRRRLQLGQLAKRSMLFRRKGFFGDDVISGNLASRRLASSSPHGFMQQHNCVSGNLAARPPESDIAWPRPSIPHHLLCWTRPAPATSRSAGTAGRQSPLHRGRRWISLLKFRRLRRENPATGRQPHRRQCSRVQPRACSRHGE